MVSSPGTTLVTRADLEHGGRNVDLRDESSVNVEDEGRAPICPFCGVTALPADGTHVLDTTFVCENPDCEAFGEVIIADVDTSGF